MLEPQQYIDNAIAAGVPMDAIDSFLAQNPGDYSRIAGAFALPTGSGDTSQTGQTYQFPTVVAPSLPAVGTNDFGGRTDRTFDAQLVSSTPLNAGMTDQYGVAMQDPSLAPVLGTEGVRSFLGGLVGMLPIPGAPALGAIIAGSGGGSGGTPPTFAVPGQIPLPGGTQPRLPAPRVPSVEIPMPRAPRVPSGATMAKIAAAAAALGITVEEYIRRYGYQVAGGSRRRMNPLNPRALRRSARRVEAFACFAKKMITFTERTHVRGVKRRACKRRKCA